MSQDDSTAPGTAPNSSAADRRSGLARQRAAARRAGARHRRRPRRRLHARRRRRARRAPTACPRRSTLTTAPVMEDLVKEAVKDVNADEPCIDIQVTAGTVEGRRRLAGRPQRRAPRDLDPGQPDLEGPADRGRLDRHADRRGPRPDARRPDRRPRREGSRVVGVRPRRRQPRDGRPERRGCLRAGPAGAVRRDEADRRDRPEHRAEDRPGRPDVRRARRRRQQPTRPTCRRSPRRAPSWCPRPRRPTSPPAAATTSSAWWRRRPACRCCSTR